MNDYVYSLCPYTAASLHCSASGSVMSRPQPSVTEKVKIVSYYNVYLSTIRRIICPRNQPNTFYFYFCITELHVRRLGAQSDEYSNGKDIKVVYM
jgi:hypothetical protein